MYVKLLTWLWDYLALRGRKILTLIGEGSHNNYAYLVVDDKSKDAVIIDPANPPEYVGLMKDFRIGLANGPFR